MTALLWLWAVAQLLAALPFLVEVAAGLPGRRAPARAGAATPRTVVLMPAHDEGAHLRRTLDALAPELSPDLRLLVVADNCSDGTAAVARAAGAAVVERHDPARRGKGHALAHGRAALAADPPAVVIVLDADCRAEPGALAALAGAAHRTGRAWQARYLLAPRPDAAPMVQVSSFALLVKNLVRQRGLFRLGAPVPLQGTGMALPWALFRDADLGGDHLVEDLALSVALARAGHPAGFLPAAGVWSDPAAAAATLGQRARWEGGFLQVARAHGPGLVAEGLRRGRPGLLWLGLHLLTPPLALLVLVEAMLAVGALGLAALVALAGGAVPLPALALSVAVPGLLVATILAAWAVHGRPWLTPRAALRLPLYLLWKLPHYARLLTGRAPAGWVRTERGG